jgi:16S rRNA (cytosine1402-N4)-methyltransferase
MSNTCSPSEYLDGDISEPSKQSEYVPNEPSVWIDTPTLSNELPTTTTQKKRRARYNGKYPKQYVEKYKELSGDVPTIQKVLQKGMTPAGQHIPIMIDECMEYLGFYAAPTLGSNHDAASHHTIQETYPSNESDVFFVDCTLGYGGHSTHILKHLLTQPSKSSHKMVCFDRDPIEIVKATDRLQKVIAEFCINPNEGDANYQPTSDMVRTVNRNFCELRTHLNEIHGTGKVTALLADLGLSSMQIDDATRGFTYKHEGPLDMRMNGTGNSTESAYDLLQRLSVSELTQILEENSDEIYAPVIAQAIVGDKVHLPSTTLELATVVRDAVRPHLLRNATGNNNKNQRESKISHLPATGKNSATIKKQLDSTVARVMQAIRIEVNAEFDSLQKLLDDLPHILAPKIGRAVFLTFHSGEDRRVKKSFKQGYNDGVYSSWSRDVVRPTSNERYNNPRSSCCKLRWVVRSDKQLS